MFNAFLVNEFEHEHGNEHVNGNDGLAAGHREQPQLDVPDATTAFGEARVHGFQIPVRPRAGGLVRDRVLLVGLGEETRFEGLRTTRLDGPEGVVRWMAENGLPVGYLLASFTGFEAFGYWIGLIAGLTAGAATLSIRLLAIQKKMAMQ